LEPSNCDPPGEGGDNALYAVIRVLVDNRDFKVAMSLYAQGLEQPRQLFRSGDGGYNQQESQVSSITSGRSEAAKERS
jgi:hypothetical protein